MNLKPRFLLLTALLFVGSAIAAWWSVRTLAEVIVEQWAVRYAEKQVLYDKSRTLQPILREIALARQLANSQYIGKWARNPDAPELTSRAIAEMESFRQNFHDRSYFVALVSNGRYYHNNNQNEFAGKEFRYVLDPKKKQDSWFFDLLLQKRDIHINVNPDIPLGITKLWIDVLIRDGNDILGMAGTGLDLTDFLKTVVEEGVPGVTSLFVDHAGAIQLHRNQDLIDFASVSKATGAHKTIDLLFEQDDDRKSILAAMKDLEAQKKPVITAFVHVQGKRHLAGIAYLPEIDWYEITLIDLDVLLPISRFSGILIVYVITLLVALILFNLVLNRLVLNPLSQLDKAMTQVEAGEDPIYHLQQTGTGEVQRLIHRFTQMAHSVLQSRHQLEEKVHERTVALDRLAKIDSLTELLNRRGMTERLEADLNRARREHTTIGVLWLDIDWFKEINDHHGHALGDDALKTVANLINSTIRPYDVAARWGGDEFLVLLQTADWPTLNALGERIRSAVTHHQRLANKAGQHVSLSVSIGGHIAYEGEPLESILQHADQALYVAKTGGRNRYATSLDTQTTTDPATVNPNSQ